MKNNFEKFKNPNRFKCVSERLIDCPRFFKIAASLCKLSSHIKANHGAVIVKGGRILGLGYNSAQQRKTINYRFMHAEMHAVLSSRSDDLSGAKIYVFREDKYGFISNSKPCVKCQSFLKSAGIRRAIYTIDERNYGVMHI